ncbi:MAG: class I SAM-dependent methyltransferase [Bacteroidetes bacterium]|nr:class I SAM-dependent methyltransferase [Bacteroidota bacterium]
MNKLKKLLKALTLIAVKPSLLNKVLDDANVNKTEVIKKYNLPQGLKTIDINHLLPAFIETVEPFSSIDGGSTPMDIALLKGLARIKPNCMYFEIGTWRGESVANVASVAKDCITLNLPDEEMLQMGLDKDYVEAHRFFSTGLKNVEHIQANSQTFNFSSLNKKFDLIFIDGDHHYESVKKDTSNAFKLLKDNDSIIVWHDYGNNPTDIRWDVLLGILDGTPADKIKNLHRVSNTLCAIYTTKPLQSAYIQPFSPPKNYYSLTVKKY